MSDNVNNRVDVSAKKANTDNGSTDPKVKSTVTVLIILVVIALLSLIAGYIYDVAHNH